jgi:hypothetical protein
MVILPVLQVRDAQPEVQTPPRLWRMILWSREGKEIMYTISLALSHFSLLSRDHVTHSM